MRRASDTRQALIAGQVGADVSPFCRASQETNPLQLSKQDLCKIPRQIPHPLDLRLGERETGHLEIFGANQVHPVANRAIRSAASASCDVSDRPMRMRMTWFHDDLDQHAIRLCCMLRLMCHGRTHTAGIEGGAAGSIPAARTMRHRLGSGGQGPRRRRLTGRPESTPALE